MTYEEAKKLADEINRRSIPEQYLDKSKSFSGNSGYCCPYCGSGTGEHKTGAVTFYGNSYYCFSCRKNFCNIDLIAKHLGVEPKGEDFFKVVEYGCKELGIPYIEADATPKKNSTFKKNEEVTSMKKKPEETKPDRSKFYEYAKSRLEDFISKQGGSWRGLSLEDLKAARAGFNTIEKDGKKIQCVIFPHDNFSYFERSIEDTPLKVKRHHGSKVIFNPYDVLKCGKPIFVVEGEIDCITIHKFDYPCIALGGAAECNLLTKTLEAEFSGVANKPNFIVLFDNNDSGAGQKAAKKLLSALRDTGVRAVNFILSPDLKYDANEFLQKDSASFKARLAEIYDSAEKEIATLENEIFGTRLNFFFRQKYFESTDKHRRFSDLKTGFSALDKNQEYEAGIYTIGAPPSLGKTSFVWQMLEQMARRSNESVKIHCIFVSYEMDEDVLFSKSMARGVFELNREKDRDFEPNKSLTSTIIRKGIPFVVGYEDDCWEVFKNLQRDESDLRILDLTQEPLELENLIRRLRDIAAALPSTDLLIFAIDYLQKIPGKENTLKESIDKAMLELKKFSQETNSIIFLISSYNRSSYRTEASFDAFKESGSIEYGSDVMWALQLYATDKNKKPSNTQEALDEAKMKQPRPMILKCLKNRFGNDYKLYFQYYSAVDTFIECTESDSRT